MLQCGDVEKLIKKRKSSEDPPVYYVSIEDTYDVIKRAHIATGHGGRDKMLKHLGTKYANITSHAVGLFKSYCAVCQQKTKRPVTKGVVVKPILSKDFGSRSQVDLIDMQSSPQAQFKWIMVYQCHLTKFVILRPLTSKRAAEVAFQLLDIFLLFGAPAILQSDNGSEFTAQVITELKDLWPQLIMVHGKPRHPQSQGSVERANADIKDILAAWMTDNNTQDWSLGLRFVQNMKNSSYHSGIKCTPYSAMFGTEPKVGLTSSSLPSEIIERLQTEDDLLAVVNSPKEESTTPATATSPQHAAATDPPPDALPTSPSPPPASHSQHTTATDSPPDAPLPVAPPAPPTTTNQLVTVEILPEPMASTSAPASPPAPLLILQETLPMQQHSEPPPLSPSPLAFRQINIANQRKRAREAQQSQAERMLKRSHVILKAGDIEDNVAVPIPSVDRGRGDPRNILGVIVAHNENDMYTIAVKSGILKSKYSRNQFGLCPERLLTPSDVNQDKHVSLREALRSTASGGQGFVKCNCSSTSKKCGTKKCKCFKAQRTCNSRCHSSLSCSNK